MMILSRLRFHFKAIKALYSHIEVVFHRVSQYASMADAFAKQGYKALILFLGGVLLCIVFGSSSLINIVNPLMSIFIKPNIYNKVVKTYS